MFLPNGYSVVGRRGFMIAKDCLHSVKPTVIVFQLVLLIYTPWPCTSDSIWLKEVNTSLYWLRPRFQEQIFVPDSSLA